MTFDHRFLALVGTIALSLIGLVACSSNPEAPEVAAAASESSEDRDGAAPPPAEPLPIEVPPPSEPIEPFEVSEEFAPAKATGAVEGVPAATNTAPIVAVANYFADLPGIDMSSLTPSQREKFLHRANSELCTCGCKNDTLANCYMNDKSCAVVKGTLLSILAEIQSEP